MTSVWQRRNELSCPVYLGGRCDYRSLLHITEATFSGFLLKLCIHWSDRALRTNSQWSWKPLKYLPITVDRDTRRNLTISVLCFDFEIALVVKCVPVILNTGGYGVKLWPNPSSQIYLCSSSVLHLHVQVQSRRLLCISNEKGGKKKRKKRKSYI